VTKTYKSWRKPKYGSLWRIKSLVRARKESELFVRRTALGPRAGRYGFPSAVRATGRASTKAQVHYLPARLAICSHSAELQQRLEHSRV